MSSLLDHLLPGIPNDVTFNHIITRLPWKACYSLSRMSVHWQQEMESREVYDSRVRHHSTETLVIIKHKDIKGGIKISLYCMREKVFYHLPQIPNLEGGFPSWSQFITTSGKLYLLGDVKNGEWPLDSNSDIDEFNTYVLDLPAGQRQWKECAGVPEGLYGNFSMGCAVVVGGQYYLRGGNADWFQSAWHETESSCGMVSPLRSIALDSNPAKLLVKDGQIYDIIPAGIFLFDGDSEDIRPWIFQHSTLSCHELGPMNSVTINVLFIFPVDNELLAVVRWEEAQSDEDSQPAYGYCLLQSKGFGTASKDIVWEKGPDCFCFDEDTSLAMCPIRL